MKNREQRDSTEPNLKHGDEYPPDMRAHENLKHLEHEPNVRSGWFPFDINNMGSLKHGGDRNGVQDQPNDDRNRAQDQPNVDKNQFQFPIFWLPYKHEEDETRGDKEAKVDHESAERSSPNLKVASAQLPSSKVGLKAAENNVNGKTNDVKQQAELHNKGKTKEGEGKARGITVKEIEHSGEKKPSDDGTERQSPSPRNTSKLPPVCLRVDPLPKRKNSHGDLRSPSPSHKEKAQEAFGDRSKSTSSIKESAEVEPNKGKIKVVKVVDGITKQDTGEDCKAQTPIRAPVNLFPKSGEEVSTNQDTSKVVKCDDVREDKEVKAPDPTVESHLGDGESQTEDGGANKAENEIPKEEDKAKRKNLSVAEATVIIQSAYRGFEARKWEPLKKLKQIAEVKEHVAQIRSQIESLESSFDNRSDDKQKLIIGETIMSLLLKLDTIQGLHTTVRNFRKSMAKELVSLQEKLDSLPTNKSKVSNVKLVEDLSMNTKGDSSFEETGNGNSFAETESNHSNISDLVEPSQCQISNIIEATSSSQIMETSEMKLVKKEACEESEDKIIASPLQSSRELVDKLKDDLNNEVIDDAEMMTLKAQTDGSELKLLVEPMPSAAEENVDSAVVVTMPSCLGDQSAASSEFNQELVIEESPKNELIEIGDCEVLQGKGEVESQSAIDITASNGEIAEANQVQQTVDALNDASGIVDPKHEIGEESNFEGHEDMMAEQEEVQKVGHIHENAKISRADDEIGLGNAPIEDARLKIEEFTVQKHEEKDNTNELLDTSEPEKPQPQLAFAEDDIHDGEACKPEEPHAEFSPLENETHCGEASKTEETWPGLSPALDKNSGQENDDSGITNDEDNCSGQDIKETKECNEESENQEIVGDRREFKELVSVAGNDKVTEQLCGSETSKEALIATQFVPAEAEELPQVEGELFPMSPNYSQVSLGSEMGSESDEKLVEENKKLREIMEKLIETGTEQLTAISNLSIRVKDLEKKLARKKKRTRRFRAGSSCVKHANDALKGTTLGIAV